MKAQMHSPDVAEAILQFRQRKAAEEQESRDRFAKLIRDFADSQLMREFQSYLRAVDSGCVLWTGYVNKTWEIYYHVGEYRQAKEILGTTLAHRIAVMLHFCEPIPDGYEIYPACGNHLCCCIDHLKIKPDRGKGRTEVGVFVSNFFARETAT
jgi:hypothetical protein